jgi:ribosomal protein L11 methyltransferase
VPRRFAKATFTTTAALADEAAGFLVARGALGCAIAGARRPGARPPRIVRLEAFFDRLSPTDFRRLRRELASAGMATGANSGGVEQIDDPGWATQWMSRFEPLRIGRRFVIVPPWARGHEPHRLRIAIKPARAFGTGHHPTTIGMLRTVEQLCSKRHFKTALDVGTGSGILAIAMRMLGIDSVVAIDIDPDALDNARDNAALNQLDNAIEFANTPLAKIRRRFDLITANILASALIELAPALKRRLAPQGVLILGGIRAREARGVLKYYQRELRLIHSRSDRGWMTLVLSQ